MKSEIVVGIDSSTTATKAIAWDFYGKYIAGGSSPVRLISPQANYYEQDPENWWHSMAKSLQELTHQIDKERITALAISNQRETFVGLDKNGNPVRPAITWLDERCKSFVDKFAAVIGEDRIHQITGKPKDYAPVVYRLAWMKEKERDLFREVAKFCDVNTYLVHKLTGHYKTSWASADPMGIFDLENKTWSQDILSHLNITLQQLPDAYCPGTVLGYVTKTAAEDTGLRTGTKVVAGGGDGQAAGLGVNALIPERVYLNLGTAVVSGAFTKNYIIDRSFRTMVSCSEDGYYCETSLRSGTFLIDWFIQQVLKIDPVRKPDIYRQLEEEAKQIEPGSEGLMILPYWNAVMNPYWDPDARGCIIGLSSGHHRGHLYRAILEGIAMEQSMATAAVERSTGSRTEEFAAMGGGAKSELWRQIIADSSGKKLLNMSSDEASSLGSGISAAVGAGWFTSFEEAAKTMVHVKGITEPIAQNSKLYQDLLNKYREIYPAIRDIGMRGKVKTSEN
ncbi:MAG: FGGY-family carbohydrate kinase [Bacteroidales bacterium]|nr:FGGY-family carbohydrate kinase [Bacteroidales bacterium]